MVIANKVRFNKEHANYSPTEQNKTSLLTSGKGYPAGLDWTSSADGSSVLEHGSSISGRVSGNELTAELMPDKLVSRQMTNILIFNILIFYNPSHFPRASATWVICGSHAPIFRSRFYPVLFILLKPEQKCQEMMWICVGEVLDQKEVPFMPFPIIICDNETSKKEKIIQQDSRCKRCWPIWQTHIHPPIQRTIHPFFHPSWARLEASAVILSVSRLIQP